MEMGWSGSRRILFVYGRVPMDGVRYEWRKLNESVGMDVFREGGLLVVLDMELKSLLLFIWKPRTFWST